MFSRFSPIRFVWHRDRGAPVDTHVLVFNSQRHGAAGWLEQCLASMENEPTNILLAHTQDQNVGSIRAHAMRKGSAPFLCFVDDDDYVEPGSFDACLHPLADPALVGAYTRFRTIDAHSGIEKKVSSATPWSRELQAGWLFEVMHLHVYRREAALPYLAEVAQWETAEEALLMGLLVQRGDWHKVDRIGYTKRSHGNGAGSRITGKMFQELQWRLWPILRPETRPTTPLARAFSSPSGCRGCDRGRARLYRRLR